MVVVLLSLPLLLYEPESVSSVCVCDCPETTLSVSVKLPAEVLPVSCSDDVDEEVRVTVSRSVRSLPVVVRVLVAVSDSVRLYYLGPKDNQLGEEAAAY